MKSKPLLYSAIVIICLSCNKKEIDNLNANLTLEQLKVSILQASNLLNLITKIDSTTSGQIIIHYEIGGSITTTKDKFISIVNSPTMWNTLFYMNDGTSITAVSVGKLNLTDSSVKVNPYGSAPLSALATLTTPIPGKMKVIVHGKPNGVTISHSFSYYGVQQQLTILGLYDNYQNQVEFQFFNANGVFRASQVLTVLTAAIPNKPTATIKTNLLSPADSSIYFSGSVPFGFDQTGAVRWYYNQDAYTFYGKLKNGNFIISALQGLTATYQTPAFYEVTMLGQVIKKYTIPNYQHHEIIEMPSGNFLIGTNSTAPSNGSNFAQGDVVAEIDRASGNIVNSWNFNAIIDPTRPPLPDATLPYDWMHLNSIFYNQSDNSLIVSSRSQSAIVKLDYSTGQIKWILAHPKYWNASLSTYLLTPANAKGQAINTDTIDFWPYGQHKVSQLSNGNILAYDDGDYRGYYDNANVGYKSYTRGVQYQINEASMTVQLVWSFNNSNSMFTQFTGSIDQFTSSNTILIGYMDPFGGTGDLPKILEIDSNNNSVFEMDLNSGSPWYRALKINLYSGMD